MNKKIFILLLPIFILLACIPKPDNGVTVSYENRGFTDITSTSTIELDGFMNIPNALHDTLVDNTMQAVAQGYSSLGAINYMQVLRVCDLGSGSDTVWTTLTFSLIAGAGDTVATMTKQANHLAPVGCLYDSCMREKASGVLYPSGDSSADWYATQAETTALAAGDGVEYKWTWTATKLGTNILDTLLWHIVDFWNRGVCDDVDTMVLVFANGDTIRGYANHSFDYPNDTLKFTMACTTRSLDNDTVKYGMLVDDDGVVVLHETINTAIANPSAPRWIKNLFFEEN